jgi:hypothetical protein
MLDTLSPLRHRLNTIVLVLVFGLLTVFALSAKAAGNDSGGSPLKQVYWGGYTGIWNSAVDACKSYAPLDAAASGASIQYNASRDNFGCVWSGGVQVNVDPSGACTEGGRLFSHSTSLSACASDNQASALPPMDATTPCLKDPGGAAAWGVRDNWIPEPRTIEYNYNNSNGVALFKGRKTASKPAGPDNYYEYAIDCYGKGRDGEIDKTKLPAGTPTPAPPVKVDFPNCGAGNYAYSEPGVASGAYICSQNLPDRTLTDCASGNGGYVGDKAVCLPANPAPGTAAAAAQTAAQKADAAVAAGRGTSPAIQAAIDAQNAYKVAKNAADSMPNSTAAAASAQAAYQSAVQGAIAAGMNVPAKIPSPTGTDEKSTGNVGGGSSSGDMCGLPGKPPCKIDETGTPTPANMTENMKAANDSVGKAWDDIKAEMDKQTNDAATKKGILDWGFNFALPTSCSTYPMFLSVKIDFCEFQPIVHELMSLVWLGATLWICIGMVGTTLRGRT